MCGVCPWTQNLVKQLEDLDVPLLPDMPTWCVPAPATCVGCACWCADVHGRVNVVVVVGGVRVGTGAHEPSSVRRVRGGAGGCLGSPGWRVAWRVLPCARLGLRVGASVVRVWAPLCVCGLGAGCRRTPPPPLHNPTPPPSHAPTRWHAVTPWSTALTWLSTPCLASPSEAPSGLPLMVCMLVAARSSPAFRLRFVGASAASRVRICVSLCFAWC